MNRAELIGLVKEIQSAQKTETEIDKLVELFLENVPAPNATDYIYAKEYEHLSAEEVVDKALVYQSIRL